MPLKAGTTSRCQSHSCLLYSSSGSLSLPALDSPDSISLYVFLKHFLFLKKLIFSTYVFLAALGLRCCLGFCLVSGLGLLTMTASLVVEQGLQGMRASVAAAHGLVAQQHVGSSQSRDQTRVSCTGRQILDHRAPPEKPCRALCSLSSGSLFRLWSVFPSGTVSIVIFTLSCLSLVLWP